MSSRECMLALNALLRPAVPVDERVQAARFLYTVFSARERQKHTFQPQQLVATWTDAFGRHAMRVAQLVWKPRARPASLTVMGAHAFPLARVYFDGDKTTVWQFCDAIEWDDDAPAKFPLLTLLNRPAVHLVERGVAAEAAACL